MPALLQNTKIENNNITEQDTAGVESKITAELHHSRYFILRIGGEAYYMRNLIVSEDRKIITCQLETLPVFHRLHLHNGRGGIMRYKKNKPEIAVLNEVHLYIPNDSNAKPFTTFTLPIDRVQKIEVIKKNKVSNTLSSVVGSLGIIVGALIVTTLYS